MGVLILHGIMLWKAVLSATWPIITVGKFYNLRDSYVPRLTTALTSSESEEEHLRQHSWASERRLSNCDIRRKDKCTCASRCSANAGTAEYMSLPLNSTSNPEEFLRKLPVSLCQFDNFDKFFSSQFLRNLNCLVIYKQFLLRNSLKIIRKSGLSVSKSITNVNTPLWE